MNTLTTVAAELEAAKADLAMYERLTSAKERVARLSRNYEAAQAEHEKQKAADAEAAHEAQFAGLRSIRVTDTTGVDAAAGGNLLRSSFRVTYIGPKWCFHRGTSVPTEHVIDGLGALPPHVLAFLIEKAPEEIPVAIMALAPGDPARAMHEYFACVRRGYIKGARA